ncbi:GNAT family N-acetyltransferase [Flavihumibacter petaseus]|uniref:Putative acetyltransferase n=1 Tax=Flavihumibacter petaseus NBRC 106054 TaxID=1220578 RepID=A0A0E9N4V1_9BACT|nr:GNAT family N-acetyltransferase [Flavihumibacter petaseus]GAO44711.1 putative acetyltransferase [Flavihumibacter petaseus NBRC 106054]
MFFIESERLRLVPLNHTQLLLLRESRAKMEIAMGLQPSFMVIDPFYQAELDDALDNFWLPNIQLHPGHYEWFTNWEIILKDGQVSVGGIGFGGLPKEDGTAMIGYCIDQQQQGRGYGTEALGAITQWAFENPAVTAVCAETGSSNHPSIKMLEKNGFVRTGHVEDRLVFRRSRQQ